MARTRTVFWGGGDGQGGLFLAGAPTCARLGGNRKGHGILERLKCVPMSRATYLLEFSAMMEKFYICAVQYGSQ